MVKRVRGLVIYPISLTPTMRRAQGVVHVRKLKQFVCDATTTNVVVIGEVYGHLQQDIDASLARTTARISFSYLVHFKSNPFSEALWLPARQLKIVGHLVCQFDATRNESGEKG